MHPAGERRHRFSPDMDGVLVEPTNQETVLGEVHDSVATIPAGCAGDLEATAQAHVEADKPNFHVKVWVEGDELHPLIEFWTKGLAGTEETFTGGYGGVAAGDVVHAQWTHEEGGASWDAATVVEFEVHSTASGSGCDLPRSAWTWAPGMASEVQPMVDAYACLVCAFQNWSTFTLCRSGASPACY